MRKYIDLPKHDPWVFYYEYTDQEAKWHPKKRRSIYSVRVCKVPKRTKDWMELQLKFHSTDYIDTIGYVKESELNHLI